MEEQDSGLRPISASQVAAMDEAVTEYQAALSGAAGAWLGARGIDQGTAATARLGVVDSPHPGHARYRGMLCIPYLLGDGRPVQLRFRCMEQHEHRLHRHGKYNTMAGDPVRIYGVDRILNAGNEIHLAEGELDALVLRQVLGLNAIGVPGAQAWKGRHRRMLAGFQRIYLWGDPDEAGAELVQTITRSLPRTTPVRLRDHDVNDTYLEHGAEGLDALLREARGESE